MSMAREAGGLDLALVLLCSSTLVLWCFSALVLWCFSALVPWCTGDLALVLAHA